MSCDPPKVRDVGGWAGTAEEGRFVQGGGAPLWADGRTPGSLKWISLNLFGNWLKFLVAIVQENCGSRNQTLQPFWTKDGLVKLGSFSGWGVVFGMVSWQLARN